MSTWARAFWASAFVALFVAAPMTFLVPSSTEYSPGVAWHEVKDLPHEKAVDLIQSRAESSPRWKSVRENVTDIWFWQWFALSWAFLTGMCFSACALVLWRMQPGNRFAP